MASTAIICAVNGSIPGIITENIPTIGWKSVDDSTTSFLANNALLKLSTNSYLSYNYFKFTGQYNSIGSVRVTNTTGVALRGVTIMATPSIYSDANKVVYAQPTQLKNNNFTSVNLTAQNSYIDLIVGPLVNGFNGPGSPGKTVTRDFDPNGLYTNFLVTQIQVAPGADQGSLYNIVLQLSYSEY